MSEPDSPETQWSATPRLREIKARLDELREELVNPGITYQRLIEINREQIALMAERGEEIKKPPILENDK